MAKMASLHAEAEFDLEAELTALNVEFTPEQLAAIALYLDLAEQAEGGPPDLVAGYVYGTRCRIP